MKYMGQQQFQLNVPLQSHWEPADCAADNCGNYEFGWRITVDPSFVLNDGTKFGQMQYDYIKHKSGRIFIETIVEDNKVLFVFPSGQQCFEQHVRKKNPTAALYNHLSGQEILTKPTVKGLHENTLEPQEFIDTMNEQMFALDKMRKEG
mgnify:CR=1 FL=1|jgi:hypothetical protein|tara:strand:- start:167 stop:613 length:447 start_codon:yes stop_codon:yes gene_type:complete